MADEGPRLLVVTDLDGTLLDATTYSFCAAREALAALKACAIPLVIATSKTLREVQDLAPKLGGDPILIVENGGAIAIPAAYSLDLDDETRDAGGLLIELGVARPLLVRHLTEIAAETGAELIGFHQLSAADVARLANLSLEAAPAALDRRYDEPFLPGREELMPAVEEAAIRRGLAVSRGGRFYHLTGPANKGTAFATVLERFARRGRRFATVGLGDAPNDLPVLRLVDWPIVMPRPDGELDATLAAALPRSERAPHAGPAGWNLAVLAVLAGRRLESVGGEAG